MNTARLAADLVLVVHAGFIAFVVLGLVAIWAGIALRWRWVRNPAFRFAHLACIGYVIFEAWSGIVCFLTEWENGLRIRAGQAGYEPAGFIAHWLHKFIFFTAPPWVFTVCYTLFGLAVLGTLILAPPRLPARRRRRSRTSPEGDQPGVATSDVTAPPAPVTRGGSDGIAAATAAPHSGHAPPVNISSE